MTDREKVALVNAIIDAYSTTRLSSVSAADHILSHRKVQDAFAAMSATRDGWRAIEDHPGYTDETAGQEVLIWSPAWIQPITGYLASTDGRVRWYGTADRHASLPDEYAPTHWQPLPATPKETPA